MRNNGLIGLLILALVAGNAFGDVPPPPGFTTVGNALVLRAKGDLAAYRFFLRDIRGESEEVFLYPTSPTVISAEGRGGPARFVTLWAVSRKKVGEAGSDKLNNNSQGRAGSPEEAEFKLLDHNFQTEVTLIDATAEYREVYEVTVDPDSGKPVATRAVAESGSSDTVPLSLVALAAGGLLIFAAIVVVGILLFRRLRIGRSA